MEKHGAESVAVGVKDHGMTDKDAINNILFLLGFNAFGGFSVFLPFLILQIGKDAALRARLRDEVRAALEQHSGEVGFASVRGMPLVRSTVYEVLRMNPPVPLQFGRARRDFVLRSHGGEGFSVAAGEMLCGYQPLAMRDPEVFDRPEEFVADRFVGAEGEALLRYVYWSNGPETGEPTLGNKQCAAKDVVVATACMLVAELFRRYDDFECDGTAFTKLQKRQPS